MAAITLSPDYGYVILAATSTFVLNVLHTFNTGHFRRVAKVAYPAAYAPSSRTDNDAQRFNSAQRAHANYTENHTTFLSAMLLAGLRYPRTAASMGVLWTLSRYMYMKGYSEGDKGGKGRYKRGGLGYYVPAVVCLGLAVWTGVQLVMGQ